MKIHLDIAKEFQRLFNFLINPELTKSHIFNDDKVLINFFPGKGSKELISLEELFAYPLKGIALSDNDLNRYVNYINQRCLIRTTEFKFENPAHQAAAYYCTGDRASKIPKFSKGVFSLSKSHYNVTTVEVSDLDKLKELKLEVKTPVDWYIIIVTPETELPEIYCSQFGEHPDRNNLINLSLPLTKLRKHLRPGVYQNVEKESVIKELMFAVKAHLEIPKGDHFRTQANWVDQLSPLAIADILSFIVLSHGLGESETKSVAAYKSEQIIPFSEESVPELLTYLLHPAMVKSHIVNTDPLRITFINSEGLKTVIPLAEIFSKVNFKKILLSEDLLKSYADYINRVFLIQENEFKFEHRGYESAASYYQQDNNHLRIDLENPEKCFSLVPDFIYQLVTHDVKSLDDLNYEQLDSEKKPNEIFIVIVSGESELPKIYCSQLEQRFSKSSLISLHDKININNYHQCFELSKLSERPLALKEIGKLLKRYFNVFDGFQLSEVTIADLTSSIVLCHGLSKKEMARLSAYRLPPHQESKKIISLPKNDNVIQRLLSYLLDPQLAKSHVYDENKNTISFSLAENSQDTICLDKLFSVINLKKSPLTENDLEKYANYINKYFFVDANEYKFQHRAYSSAASYCENIRKTRVGSNFQENKFISVDYYEFRTIDIPNLDNLNYEELESEKEPYEVIIIIVDNKQELPQIYCSHLWKKFSKDNLINLHEKITIKPYCDRLDHSMKISREKTLTEIEKEVKKYFNITNTRKLSAASIADLASSIVLKHGMAKQESKLLPEYSIPKPRPKEVLPTVETPGDIQELLSNLLDPQRVKSHWIDRDYLTITFSVGSGVEKVFNLQSLFSSGNLKKLSLEDDLLYKYQKYIEPFCDIKEYKSDLKHPGHALAAHYYTAHGIKINTILRKNSFSILFSQLDYNFIEIETSDLSEIRFSELQSKKGIFDIFIIIVLPKNELPEIYCSPLGWELNQSSLINLHDKIFIQEYRRYFLPTTHRESRSIALQEIKNTVKTYFSFFDKRGCRFDNLAIARITSLIVLSHGLNQHQTKLTDTFRLLNWNDQKDLPWEYKLSEFYVQEPAFLSFSGNKGALRVGYDSIIPFCFIYSKNNPGVDISPVSTIKSEDEVLVAPGAKIIYHKLLKIENFTFFEAEFLDSKQITNAKRPSDEIEKHFFQYVMENILNNEFKDKNISSTDSKIVSSYNKDLIVYKPKYAICHILRKMERTPSLIDLFGYSASSSDFSEFCLRIQNDEKLIVLNEEVSSQHLLDEIALLSGSTSLGVESASLQENIRLYTKYRSLTVERFIYFLKSLESSELYNFKISSKRLEIYKNILLNLDDPEYIKKPAGFELWVMHIVNTSHVLDLPRCLNASCVIPALETYLKPVLQISAYLQIHKLVNLAVFWLKLTGDQICEEYVIPSQNYQNEFILNSTIQILKCRELLRHSPGLVFFSDLEEKSSSARSLRKMVKHLCTTLLMKNPLGPRPNITENLKFLIHGMARSKLSFLLKNTFLEILLTKRLAKLSHENPQEGDDALISAIREESIGSQIVSSLLEAKVSPNLTNVIGEAPLMIAALNEGPHQNGKINLLLDYKADPTLVDWNKVSQNNKCTPKNRTPNWLAHFLLMKPNSHTIQQSSLDQYQP